METHSYFAEPRGFIWLREGEITIIWRNVVQTFQADLAIIGAGGAGLRAAIAAAQANPNAKIALISKVYPMR
ncbi:FAD-binding protein, partial [Salmonella enterica]|nr:FAD-binding protein [Salmonella enterica subsp. enterica serovar Montevideo]